MLVFSVININAPAKRTRQRFLACFDVLRLYKFAVQYAHFYSPFIVSSVKAINESAVTHRSRVYPLSWVIVTISSPVSGLRQYFAFATLISAARKSGERYSATNFALRALSRLFLLGSSVKCPQGGFVRRQRKSEGLFCLNAF